MPNKNRRESRAKEAPRERDPFAEGSEAFHAGRSDTSNPYPVKTDEHLSWAGGYNAASEAEDESGEKADDEA